MPHAGKSRGAGKGSARGAATKRTIRAKAPGVKQTPQETGRGSPGAKPEDPRAKRKALLSDIQDDQPAASRRRKAAPEGSERRRLIDGVKEALLSRLADLRGGMRKKLESCRSVTPVSRGDASDLAADSLDTDTALQLAQKGSSEIAQVEEALQKMEDGTYGDCELCGREIPWERMSALPYATLCIECKRREEISGRGAAGWPPPGVEDLGEEETE